MSVSKNYGTLTQWNTHNGKTEGTPREHMLNEISQRVTDKYHTIAPISGT